jgi:2-polyprenyl-3-methyl-5-hydroxy-6-metoxy-1,4-benzoquinol methylase
MKWYGIGGASWARTVEAIATDVGARTVLDYGCGKGRLRKALKAAREAGLKVREYDPAIPGKDGPPKRADLVVATDVLEHVEPDRLVAVLEHLASLTVKRLFVVVATRPAHKRLQDGRNAHLTVAPASWWKTRLAETGLVRVRYALPVVDRSMEWAALFGRPEA